MTSFVPMIMGRSNPDHFESAFWGSINVTVLGDTINPYYVGVRVSFQPLVSFFPGVYTLRFKVNDGVEDVTIFNTNDMITSEMTISGQTFTICNILKEYAVSNLDFFTITIIPPPENFSYLGLPGDGYLESASYSNRAVIAARIGITGIYDISPYSGSLYFEQFIPLTPPYKSMIVFHTNVHYTSPYEYHLQFNDKPEIILSPCGSSSNKYIFYDDLIGNDVVTLTIRSVDDTSLEPFVYRYYPASYSVSLLPQKTVMLPDGKVVHFGYCNRITFTRDDGYCVVVAVPFLFDGEIESDTVDIRYSDGSFSTLGNNRFFPDYSMFFSMDSMTELPLLSGSGNCYLYSGDTGYYTTKVYDIPVDRDFVPATSRNLTVNGLTVGNNLILETQLGSV
ncbi:MAG: hypothetical protein PHR14_08835 [Oscillospiraceae bacterium]|nr:hypothetical protein [Oscillospiraceae bacterium]